MEKFILKEQYRKPDIKIILIDEGDVIATSDEETGGGGNWSENLPSDGWT